MKRPHIATIFAGSALALLGGYSLLHSRTKMQGKVRFTLLLMGMAIVPLSFFVYEKSKD